QVPLDIAGCAATDLTPPVSLQAKSIDEEALQEALHLLAQSKQPVILVGGGAKRSGPEICALAERLDAPVIQTTNARGVMFQHPLGVPASPSLASVRNLIESADVVLALGTEFGPTDYDMYATGVWPKMQALIRVDLCAAQLARHPAALPITADVASFVAALQQDLPSGAGSGGEARAAEARRAAQQEIGADYLSQVEILGAMRDVMPGSLMVGDSTQPIYAGNLYYDHDRPGGWFNAATGYGALGYGIPAAIGAAIAEPDVPVICIVGDGGAQFSLPEVMTAVDENLSITFVIWNNQGYREIATSMEDVGVAVVGCDPTPPSFAGTAQSFGIPHVTVGTDAAEISAAVAKNQGQGPRFVEITAPVFVPAKD
ncbi:thiamine pyrophosphate-dependent enzyme, partial [Pseudophaeobacter sp.]|uniref:thiamine pyrophosphate-dependent enzyme n=1 Tax=Pseudophaeobacter sp. TaxID=1971739 RepID=UPI003299AA44